MTGLKLRKGANSDISIFSSALAINKKKSAAKSDFITMRAISGGEKIKTFLEKRIGTERIVIKKLEVSKKESEFDFFNPLFSMML